MFLLQNTLNKNGASENKKNESDQPTM